MPLYVIGHRNPDTDAICSAIAYAWFLRETGTKDAEAACCGEINPRTQYVLQRAGLEPPRLIMDVRPTVGQIARREIVSVREDETVHEAYQRIRERGYQTIVALDGEGNLAGLVPLARLMELLLPRGRSLEDTRLVHSSLERVAAVLQGTFLNASDPGAEETLTIMVGAMTSASMRKHARKFPADHLLVVTGDRPTVQKAAIEYGVRALVVTGGFEVQPDLLEMARDRNVNVISSPLDTATTTLLIRSAKVITGAVEKEFLSFREKDLVSEARKAIALTAQSLFPVLDDQKRLRGVFTKTDLLAVKPARLVLVDHNEMAQAVPGIEQADIIEVIDHHRLGGGMVSREPIRFVNEPVGSTCTIVAKFLHHRDWMPPRPVACCLIAGIVSDTLNLASPTTTPADRTMLEWLARGSGIDVKQFAEEFFAAGSALQTHTPADAIGMDAKEYEENGWRFAVSQIEESGFDLFWRHKDALLSALEVHARARRLHFACVLVTDITRTTSYLLTAGDERVSDAIDYPRHEPRLFQLDGVVSRKKQLLPHIIRILSKLDR